MRFRAENTGLWTRAGRRTRAFTLVEVLIVIAISGVLFLALATFTNSSLRMTGVLQDKNVAGHTARTALARFTREISLANRVVAAEEHNVAFTCTDITGDGADDFTAYAWDPDSKMLVRTLNGVTETFAENVDLFSVEYEYETENEVTIASAGDTLSFVAGSFDGTQYDGDNYYINVMNNWAAHYFKSAVELPSVNSITVRAMRKMDGVPTCNMVIWLQTQEGYPLAFGELEPSQLTTSWQDITVPVEWVAEDGVGIQADTVYAVCVMPSQGGSYAGSIYVRKIDGELPAGCGWWFASMGWPITPRDDWTMYFRVQGNLTITTPSRQTTPVSVLKRVKVTIRVNEGDEQAELVRTCKVLNQ